MYAKFGIFQYKWCLFHTSKNIYIKNNEKTFDKFPDSCHKMWLPHDKTNKMTVRPAKTQMSLGIRPIWSVFSVRSMGSYGPKPSSCEQRRLIRLGGCPGWSESSLAAQIILLVCHEAAQIYFKQCPSKPPRKIDVRRTTVTGLIKRVGGKIRCKALPSILSVFPNEFDKFSNTGARMQDSV